MDTNEDIQYLCDIVNAFDALMLAMPTVDAICV
jgi:hypothetical protein